MKAGLSASVLRKVCERTCVSLYPMGGFSSLSFIYEAAQAANWEERQLTILYCGDYDPSGVLIDQSLETEMRKHLFGRSRLLAAGNHTRANQRVQPTRETPQGQRETKPRT